MIKCLLNSQANSNVWESGNVGQELLMFRRNLLVSVSVVLLPVWLQSKYAASNPAKSLWISPKARCRSAWQIAEVTEQQWRSNYRDTRCSPSSEEPAIRHCKYLTSTTWPSPPLSLSLSVSSLTRTPLRPSAADVSVQRFSLEPLRWTRVTAHGRDFTPVTQSPQFSHSGRILYFSAWGGPLDCLDVHSQGYPSTISLREKQRDSRSIWENLIVLTAQNSLPW